MKALLIAATAGLMSYGPPGTDKPTLPLYVLPHGYVRIDHGPKMDLKHLRRELQRMAAQKPPPEIRIQPTLVTSSKDLMAVLKVFQKQGYNHLGFVVNTQQ